MHPQHQNLALVKGANWMSQNHSKQLKTRTPKNLKMKIKAPERYDFDIVSYAPTVREEIDSFEPTTY